MYDLQSDTGMTVFQPAQLTVDTGGFTGYPQKINTLPVESTPSLRIPQFIYSVQKSKLLTFFLETNPVFS